MAVKQLPKISDLPEPPDRLVGDQERFGSNGILILPSTVLLFKVAMGFCLYGSSPRDWRGNLLFVKHYTVMEPQALMISKS